MGFKADVSFLEKLSMGASATRSAIEYLRGLGFSPIELERYATSNKIWSTKVKRLRLADLLCVRTGVRFEVRGKSVLQIRMSDSPTNPDRRWDAGLRDEDLIALVACAPAEEGIVCRTPVCFSVRDLRASVDLARLGPPKSASEGAERDLTWPAIVPPEDGRVVEVTPEHVRVEFDSGRRQTYRRNGKVCYLRAGDRFAGGAAFIAAAPAQILDPRSVLTRDWSPRAELGSANATDRYAAAKALAVVPGHNVGETIQLLERALVTEAEPRTALEVAGALAKLGADTGFEYLDSAIRREDDAFLPYLRMEAVFILSEIRGDRAAASLDGVVRDAAFRDNELRQAAVWGLGRFGIEAYDRIVRHIADAEDDVALHAIAGLGPNASDAAIESCLRSLLESADRREQAASSAALCRIGSPRVADRLVRASRETDSPWVPATLGRLPESALAGLDLGPELSQAIRPVAVLSEPNNWLAERGIATDFQFLLRQDL